MERSNKEILEQFADEIIIMTEDDYPIKDFNKWLEEKNALIDKYTRWLETN